MSISKRQLYAFGETFGESATQSKPGGRVYGGGGGGATSMPEVPKELKPLANLYTKQAEQLAQTPWQGYNGQRFADTNQTQNMGIGMVQNRALNGDPTMNQATDTLQQTLRGGQTNPYLDSLVSKAQGSVVEQFNNMTKPQTESAMVNSGSFGNAGLSQMMQTQQKAAADKMGDIATSMYGNAYNTDRANQMNALQMAPTYGNQAYQDAGQLMNAGNFQQSQQQRNMDFGYQQFQDAQNDPYKKMQATGGVISQGTGQRTTTEGGK